jgi:ribosomal protein S12 methylthiotransferase
MSSMDQAPTSRRKVGFVSLGCPKALVDSERIITQLKIDGYDIAPSFEDADVVVVNTCGFIDSARAESLEAIGEAVDANGRVIVTGCLGVHADMIRDLHPRVLSISGPQQYESVVGAVHQHAPITRGPDPFMDLVPAQGIKLTPRHYAYLKISEGCNHKCSFCIIPSMRGKLASRPVAEVLGEAERLVKAGVKELLVISQDTSAYGVDIGYQPGHWHGLEVRARMTELCAALGMLGVWVRLHYVYPYPHVDELMPLMAAGKILPYLDIPMQHGNPRILKLMRRPAAADKTLQRIHSWRKDCPQLAIRSTFIVGFPGETDAEFEDLLAFLDEAQLDRVGCFQYSPVQGAAANELPDPVPGEVKAEREARFMARQALISRQRLQSKVGTRLQVLVDEVGEDSVTARSYADAPEIDGQVLVRGAPQARPGDLLQVLVTGAGEHDLEAIAAAD